MRIVDQFPNKIFGLELTPDFMGTDDYFYNGIHFDFRRGRHYIKVPGQAPLVAPFESLFSVSNDGNSKYRNASGLLVSGAVNTPRIESDFTGNIRGLLIEGARTNIGLHSENMNGAAWAGGTGLTISADATTAPDGLSTADKLVEDGTSGEHRRRQTITTTAGATVATSIFLKAAENPRINIRVVDGAVPTDGVFAVFDGTTGTVVTSSVLGAGSGLKTLIEPYINGWWRCSLVGKPNGTMISAIVDIFEVDGATTTTNYAGDGSSGNFVWGFQFEEASFSSSYIPTVASSITRISEQYSRTDNPQIVLSNSGTLFAEVYQPDIVAGGQYAIFGKDNAGTGGNPLYRVTAAWNTNDGTNTFIKSGITAAGLMRAAAAWDVGGMSVTHSGLPAATGTFDGSMLDAGTVLSLGTRTTGGADSLYGHISRFDFWPDRKSDEFLRQITQ